MWTAIKSGLLILARALGLAETAARRDEREEAERTGAAKQRAADQEQALEDKDDQLDEAVNRRPGDARRRLDNGDF